VTGRDHYIRADHSLSLLIRIMIKINLTSVLVDDQEKARAFYTDVLGFVTKTDQPMGEHRWLTVVAPEGSREIELLLEPNAHPAAQEYQRALRNDGIPAASFGVEDIKAEFERLTQRGVNFTVEPVTESWGAYAVIDDTRGNLIGLHQAS
jgi:predicted enzyme related to lactoylglutathione lyase